MVVAFAERVVLLSDGIVLRRWREVLTARRHVIARNRSIVGPIRQVPERFVTRK